MCVYIYACVVFFALKLIKVACVCKYISISIVGP